MERGRLRDLLHDGFGRDDGVGREDQAGIEDWNPEAALQGPAGALLDRGSGRAAVSYGGAVGGEWDDFDAVSRRTELDIDTVVLTWKV